VAERDLSRRGFIAGAAATATAWLWQSLPASGVDRTMGARVSQAVVFPSPRHWLPGSGEVDPSVKLRAVELLEAIGTWGTGQAGVSAAKKRVAALGLNGSLVDQARSLLAPTPHAVTHVIDAQYGGILASSASVLVVLEQWLQRTDGSVVHRGTTVDVRLVGAHPKWHVTALHPARPGAAGSLTAAARSVLANPRIRLPFAARADVRSGGVHDSVLHTLTTLSKQHVLNVSVMKSGHPIYVFGTSRHSDHPRGRAVDIWAIDGYPVVRPAHRALVLSVMRRASELGPWQVGGPVDLDGGGRKFFSDRTHQDHIHLGFSS
jgi:hypothetical protein